MLKLINKTVIYFSVEQNAKIAIQFHRKVKSIYWKGNVQFKKSVESFNLKLVLQDGNLSSKRVAVSRIGLILIKKGFIKLNSIYTDQKDDKYLQEHLQKQNQKTLNIQSPSEFQLDLLDRLSDNPAYILIHQEEGGICIDNVHGCFGLISQSQGETQLGIVNGDQIYLQLVGSSGEMHLLDIKQHSFVQNLGLESDQFKVSVDPKFQGNIYDFNTQKYLHKGSEEKTLYTFGNVQIKITEKNNSVIDRLLKLRKDREENKV